MKRNSDAVTLTVSNIVDEAHLGSVVDAVNALAYVSDIQVHRTASAVEQSPGKLPTDAGEQLPKLVTVRAYRILPQDIVWGIEHDGGFKITEPFTCDKGALPGERGWLVSLGPIEVSKDRLMLVEARR